MIQKRRAASGSSVRSIPIPLRGVVLQGILSVPDDAQAAVLFIHGSGSSRLSPRNRFVADRLVQWGLGTLLMDLLTPQEDADPDRRFDIPFLTDRVEEVTSWFQETEEGRELRIGYFGASTGAAAALWAAADLGSRIGAVVSRGGRPDLAADVLDRVQAATLLIVGGEDVPVLEWNREAFERLREPKHLVEIPGATHLFEEPGALERVADEAAAWFDRYLAAP